LRFLSARNMNDLFFPDVVAPNNNRIPQRLFVSLQSDLKPMMAPHNTPRYIPQWRPKSNISPPQWSPIKSVSEIYFIELWSVHTWPSWKYIQYCIYSTVYTLLYIHFSFNKNLSFFYSLQEKKHRAPRSAIKRIHKRIGTVGGGARIFNSF